MAGRTRWAPVLVRMLMAIGLGMACPPASPGFQSVEEPAAGAPSQTLLVTGHEVFQTLVK